MSLTADDGIRVFVDGEDVTGEVEVHSLSGVPRSFDVEFPQDITVVNGDTVSLSWDMTIVNDGAKLEVTSLAPLSGRMRVARYGPTISPEDYAIIDDFIIDSVAAGHARRL